MKSRDLADVILWSSSTQSPIRYLGPHQIASWLRQNGYSVKVIDFCNLMSIADLVAITEAHIGPETLTIGVSTTFWPRDWGSPQHAEGVEPEWLIRARLEIEKRQPHVRWSMGGANASRYNRERWTLFHGNAEDSYLSWLDEKRGLSPINRKAFDIQTLTRSYHFNDYIQPYEVLPIELGRGCMFKCKFCAYEMIGKKPGTYLRRYDLVHQEILEHHKAWGTSRFYYVDSTVNESHEKMQALANIAQSVPFPLEWIGYIRADLVWSHDNGKTLQESGLRSAFIGIESFERDSSLLVGKGWSGKEGKRWLLKQREEWERKIGWHLGFVIGLPGQTSKQLEDDCQWLIDNEMGYWNHFALWLEPGLYDSEFCVNSQKYGFKFPDSSRPWYWEHQNWTLDSALAMDHKLAQKSDPHLRLAGWTLGEIASLGFDMSEIANHKISQLPWSEIDQKSKRLVNQYVRSHFTEAERPLEL